MIFIKWQNNPPELVCVTEIMLALWPKLAVERWRAYDGRAHTPSHS